MKQESGFFGKEYIAALQKHYPDRIARIDTIDRELHIGPVHRWVRNLDCFGVDASTRYQRITDRPWGAEMSAWAVSGGRLTDVRLASAYGSYKGLLRLKPAIDLVLYSSLIWELQPRTILEFGSLQGGSAMWFADQLQVLCGGGEVHSFELCYECISPRASHPDLHFHKADLRDLTTLDEVSFEQLPHPWLVVDDSHENLENLVPFVASHMTPGDYYVLEDVLLWPNSENIAKMTDIFSKQGFLVDSKYTDAFGKNVTCSPNGWLVKQ